MPALRLFLASFCCIFLTFPIWSQSVGINDTGSSPAPSSILDVSSDSKGILIPRLKTVQRLNISAPANGLLVYDIDEKAFFYYNGSIWTSLGSSHLLSDADQDTKIDVEDTPDSDQIRFEVAGTEKLVLKESASGDLLIDLVNNNENIYLGTQASLGISGNSNVILGSQAATNLFLGSGNVMVGDSSSFSSTKANNNVALGYKAGAKGSGNISIGYQAGSNEITSNRLYIDNTNSSTPLIYGNFDKDELQVNGDFDVHTPNSTHAKIRIMPEHGSQDSSSIMLAENSAGDVGMRWLFDGVTNVLSLSGIVYDDVYGPHLTIERDNGVMGINGDVNIGSQNLMRFYDINNNPTIILNPQSSFSNRGRISVDEVFFDGEDKQLLTNGALEIYSENSTLTSLSLLPKAVSANDSSQLFFGEDKNGSYGMYFTYDGLGNNLELFGKSNSTITGPHLSINRNNGDMEIGNDSRIILTTFTNPSSIILDPAFVSSEGTRGRVITQELEITGGADLVEFFNSESNEILEPGELVSISLAGNGEICKSKGEYDRRLIGVVSGGKDIAPGLMLGQKDRVEVYGDIPIAIAGRVYVAVDPDSKEIRPGDLITSSNVSGKCMKAEDGKILNGSIIGKALTKVSEGFLLVLINLR